MEAISSEPAALQTEALQLPLLRQEMMMHASIQPVSKEAVLTLVTTVVPHREMAVAGQATLSPTE